QLRTVPPNRSPARQPGPPNQSLGGTLPAMHSIRRRLRRGIAVLVVLGAIAGPAAPSVLAVPSQIANISTLVRNSDGVNVSSVPVGTTVHPRVRVWSPSGIPTGTVSIRLWRTNGT